MLTRRSCCGTPPCSVPIERWHRRPQSTQTTFWMGSGRPARHWRTGAGCFAWETRGIPPCCSPCARAGGSVCAGSSLPLDLRGGRRDRWSLYDVSARSLRPGPIHVLRRRGGGRRRGSRNVILLVAQIGGGGRRVHQLLSLGRIVASLLSLLEQLVPFHLGAFAAARSRPAADGARAAATGAAPDDALQEPRREGALGAAADCTSCFANFRFETVTAGWGTLRQQWSFCDAGNIYLCTDAVGIPSQRLAD